MHQRFSQTAPTGRDRSGVLRWNAAAALVITAQLGMVAWLVVPGGLYIDDVRAQAYAADRPIWPFIVESNRTHLSPGARSFDWLQATFWPLEHWPAVVVTLATSALLGVVIWRLLRLLLPARPGLALAGLSVALFSASLVPALAWYRQTLTTLVALVAILQALDASIRYFRGGRWPWPVLAVLLHPVALAFSERAVVLPVVVAVSGLALGTASTRGRRLARTAVVAIPMALTNLLFLAFYSSGSYDKGTQGDPTLVGFLLTTARSLFVNTVPALVGGPVLWRPAEPSYAYAQTPAALVVVACGLVLMFAVAALRSRGPSRGTAARVCVISLAYILPVYAILYVGRVSRASITSVDDLRLYPDVGVFLVVALAVVAGAALPPGSVLRSRPRKVFGTLAAVAVMVMTVVSWAGFADRWHASPTSGYLSALRSDLARDKGMMVPSPVPADVIPGWVQPDFLTASLARLMSPETELTKAEEPRVIAGDDGRLVKAQLTTLATAPRATDDFCGNALPAGESALRIDFVDPVAYYRGSHLQLRVLVSDTTTLRLTVTGEDGSETAAPTFTHPRLHRGPHTLLVPVPYDVRVSAVTISSSQESAGVCIPGLSVVLPKAQQ